MVVDAGATMRPAREEKYYLNRRQAIFITAKSETEKATDITALPSRNPTAVVTAVRRGDCKKNDVPT
jgi:hypothetical protein